MLPSTRLSRRRTGSEGRATGSVSENRSSLLPWAALLALLTGLAVASSAQILRDDFGKGVQTPEGWTLQGGRGQWDPAVGGRRSISVTGDGNDMSYWAHKAPGLQPNHVYAIRFRSKALPGTSQFTIISGLDVCNRDFATSETWSDYSFVFTTPSDVSSAFLRLGQWHMTGTVAFSQVELLPVTPVHRSAGGVVLGEGETLRSGRYEFRAPLSAYGSNSSRCLVSHTAPFNTNRWVFTGGLQVTYCHETTPYRQRNGSLRITIGYYSGGELAVSASTDGTHWHDVGRAAASGDHRFTLPSALFPSSRIYVRLTGAARMEPAGDSAPGSLQVEGYQYSAELEQHPPDIDGATTYLQVRQHSPDVAVQVEDLGPLGQSDQGNVVLRVTSHAPTAGRLTARWYVRVGATAQDEEFAESVAAQPGKPAEFHIPYRIRGSGELWCRLIVERTMGSQQMRVYEAGANAYLPTYFAADYGHPLTPVPDGDLWWCEATYKVPLTRLPPPQEFGAGIADLKAVRGKGAIVLQAARREREHAQLVFRPFENTGPITVTVSHLTGPGNAKIPSSAVEVREVAYVRVTQPTDRTGVAAPWPDPLPPLQGAWRPQTNVNNVLWLTVTVPPNARAGGYTGTLTLRTAKWKREVLIKLHVWGFALPVMTTLRSGFGVQPGNIARYHNLKTPAQLAQVWDLYMRAFRKRRINPYNPMALSPYKIEVEGVRWSGGTRVSDQPAAGKYCLRITDNNTAADVSATYTELIPVQPGKPYRISWMCRTAKPGQPYMVTVSHYDSAKQWMSGRNNDIVRTGQTDWTYEQQDIGPSIPASARYVQITLRPTVWTERGENTGTAWFDTVRLEAGPPEEELGGRPRSLLDDGDFETEPKLEVNLDFTEFDKAARRYLDGMGFNAFTIHVEGLPGGRYPNFDHGSFFGFQADTPEFDALMRDYGRKLEEHLAQNGWLGKAYVYWYDEPEVNDYPIVQQGAARLRKYFPRLKRMMTEQFEEPLYGHVDLWCPITPTYDTKKAWARQAMGEEVWWYVCTGPKEPYCTLFIDKPAIELRMWLWQTWQRRIQGILIWETTWWTSPQQFTGDHVQNPWEDPMAYVADVSGVWGNGDGRFFYPPNRHPNTDRETPYMSGPVDSLRWEMLGEGIEDWEYFHLLSTLVNAAESRGRKDALVQRARRLLTVPREITSDLTHFTTDPQLLYRHRRAVAEAIEALLASRPSRQTTKGTATPRTRR